MAIGNLSERDSRRSRHGCKSPGGFAFLDPDVSETSATVAEANDWLIVTALTVRL